MIALPTYDQVLQLRVMHEGVVEESFIDENGHMNIGDYFRLASRSLWDGTKEAGMDDHYIGERGRSAFTVEHHIRYLGEMRLGQSFSVHNRFLARSDKVVHGMAFVVDRTGGQLACTLEGSWVHVDMQTRRASAMPDDVADGFDRLIAEGERATWPAPVCGVMGPR